MDTLEGKVVLITGAAKRVGAIIARRLHGAGMNVALHFRSARDAATELRDSLETTRRGSVELISADLLERDAAAAIVRAAAERWGRLDALVNNASTFFPTRLGEISHDHWDELVGVNLESPFFLAQAALGHLRRSSGVVVNLVDIYADRPLKGYPVYSIAKAGLVMMTKSLAREMGPEVRVNAVAPGAILWPESGTSADTQATIIRRTALRRKGSPEDVAGAVLYLIRDAHYVTGQVLTVDGGRTLTN